MSVATPKSAWILASGILLGLLLLGLTLGQSLLRFKEYERTVTVKGLSERTVPADTALWPVTYTASGNDLPAVFTQLEKDGAKVRDFLRAKGFKDAEITLSAPNVNDKGQYADENRAGLRYYVTQTATVYTKNIELVRAMNTQIAELGKQGVGVGGGYQSTDYQFSGLNALKPQMIEEATRNARQVAQKFAEDSNSRLGKIKSASQGQFSLEARDANTPHIKAVRVVATVEYYLSD
jgi:hypothetical protein